MLEKIDNLRMTDMEAAGRYPDKYILSRSDSRDPDNEMSTVFYIADEEKELYPKFRELKHMDNLGIIEGFNRRDWIGGIVLDG